MLAFAYCGCWLLFVIAFVSLTAGELCLICCLAWLMLVLVNLLVCMDE